MQDMQCPPVRIRVDRNRSHPHLAASTNYPQSDLAAICNQYFFYRSSQAAILQQLYNRKTAPQNKGGLPSREASDSASYCGYCIVTPPCAAFSFFCSFALRAPMAFCILSSTSAISSF